MRLVDWLLCDGRQIANLAILVAIPKAGWTFILGPLVDVTETS
jgi:hypothetical protein